MSNRFRRSFVAMTFVVVFSACGHDSTGLDKESIAGTYHLVTYLGNALPAIYLETDTDTLTLQSDTLIVADSGTFTDQRALRVHNGGVNDYSFVSSLNGTWVRSGTTVVFTWVINGSGAPVTSMLNGTLTGSGFQFVDSAGGTALTYIK